jgi:hypothetical protein
MAGALALQDVSYAVIGAVTDAPAAAQRRLSQADASGGAISVAVRVYADASSQGSLLSSLTALRSDLGALRAAFAAVGFNAAVLSMSEPTLLMLVPSLQGPAAVSQVTHVITGAISVSGFAAASVTAAQQRGFAAGLAQTLHKNTNDTLIVSVTAARGGAAGRRRLLTETASVSFNVNAGSRNEADGVMQALIAPATLTTLAANIQTDFPGITAADLALEVPPMMVSSAGVRAAAATAAGGAAALLALVL